MTTTPPEPEPYPWLPSADALAWLDVVDAGDTLASVADWCRQASAAYCERQRPDLTTFTVDTDGDGVADSVPVFNATPDVKLAGLIGAARLYARRSTPTGLASFGEFGASDILRLDPDVSRLLGVGRHGTPRVG